VLLFSPTRSGGSTTESVLIVPLCCAQSPPPPCAPSSAAIASTWTCSYGVVPVSARRFRLPESATHGPDTEPPAVRRPPPPSPVQRLVE
jgi:hypothetical protein